jgi:hypothetical protein
MCLDRTWTKHCRKGEDKNDRFWKKISELTWLRSKTAKVLYYYSQSLVLFQLILRKCSTPKIATAVALTAAWRSGLHTLGSGRWFLHWTWLLPDALNMFKGTSCFLDLFYLLLYVLQKYRKEVPPFFVHGATILQISLEVIQCNTFYHLPQGIIIPANRGHLCNHLTNMCYLQKLQIPPEEFFHRVTLWKFARGFSILSLTPRNICQVGVNNLWHIWKKKDGCPINTQRTTFRQ